MQNVRFVVRGIGPSRCWTVVMEVQYTERHNSICKIIHQNLAYTDGLITKTYPDYQYEPQAAFDCSVYGMQ